MRTTRHVPNDIQVHEAIVFLFDIGYSKDAISLILKGITKSGRVSRFLIEKGLTRTREEAIAVKVKNKIGFNKGYEEIRRVLKSKFPGLLT